MCCTNQSAQGQIPVLVLSDSVDTHFACLRVFSTCIVLIRSISPDCFTLQTVLSPTPCCPWKVACMDVAFTCQVIQNQLHKHFAFSSQLRKFE